jgi:hypothetical protein
MRCCATRCCMAAATLVAFVAQGVSAQATPAQSAAAGREALSIRINPENARVSNYLHDLAGPSAFVSYIGGGLLDHLRHKPASLDHDVDGLAERMASRAAAAAVEVSVRHGLAAVMHYSTDYQPCDCHGFGPRVGHALLETFTDRRADGSRALSVPRMAGAYAGNFAQLAWQHDRKAGDVALSTTLSFGFSALFNIARELTGVGRRK